MPHSFKHKILLGGLEDPNNFPFFSSSNFNKEDFSHIGISINSIECYSDDGDSYLFIFWHLNPDKRFQFLIPSFFLGSKAAILCIDRSNDRLLRHVKQSIKMIREKNKGMPIYLLSFHSKTSQKEVSKEVLHNLIDAYKIDGYFSSNVQNDKMTYMEKKKFFIFLIKELHQDTQDFSDNFSVILPIEEKDYKQFEKKFSICPICKRKNHYENLKEFYFGKEQELMIMRDKFLEIENVLQYKIKKLDINLGIPCCQCFKKYFKKNNR
jgi:GTPase SAR1 family protein